MSLRLDWCSQESAKYAVLHWHYSKRMPLYKQAYIGVWEDDRFIGAVIFGSSITPHLGDMFGLAGTEVAELTRVALRDHTTPVSRIVAIAIKMIRKRNPGLRLLVSYADPVQGHRGTIYQAMNWVYIGESAGIRQYYFRGAWRNDTSMFRAFKENPRLRELSPSRDLPPKHKYLYPLDSAMKAKIEMLQKPYPKG